MPSATSVTPNAVTKFTNCRLLRGDTLVPGDLFVSSLTGKIIHSQSAFYDNHIAPDTILDLGGRILSPGFIDSQLNGAFGFNFSTLMEGRVEYDERLHELEKRLVETGVTSYVPTVTSQLPEMYHAVLPSLGPTPTPTSGSESLGAHVEGPFLSPSRPGVHNPSILLTATTLSDLTTCYGPSNLFSPPVKVITVAPEVSGMMELIPKLVARGIVVSIGHSGASFEEASEAVGKGAGMITHLFNAMGPVHHRDPGIFGVLGVPESTTSTTGGVGGAAGDRASCGTGKRPYFGMIADGVHVHPTTIKIAYTAHPAGLVLVTDAMHMLGMPDGPYDWTNGDRSDLAGTSAGDSDSNSGADSPTGGKTRSRLVKKGGRLLLEGSTTLAGSTTELVDCVSNFVEWTGAGVAAGLKAVTETPAAMLGVKGVKGTLEEGGDADLVVLSEVKGLGTGEVGEVGSAGAGADGTRLRVDEVWKFGQRVYKRQTEKV